MTLISQPDMQLVMVQSGPGRSQPAKNFIPGKRDNASAPGVGRLLCIADTPCFQGALQLIQCHSHKWGKEGARQCLCQSHPAGRNIRAQRGGGHWVRSLLVRLSLAPGRTVPTGAPRVPALSIHPYPPSHLCTIRVHQEFFLSNSRMHFPVADTHVPVLPEQPTKHNCGRLLSICRPVSTMLSQVVFWSIPWLLHLCLIPVRHSHLDSSNEGDSTEYKDTPLTSYTLSSIILVIQPQPFWLGGQPPMVLACTELGHNLK